MQQRPLKLLLSVIIFILINLSYTEHGQSQEASKLDITFVLDISGSMDVPTARLTVDGIDLGYRRIFTTQSNGITDLPATDPKGIRFGVTESVMEWLSAYTRVQDNLDINAAVVAYNDAPTILMDWKNLQRTDDTDSAFTNSLNQGVRMTEKDVRRPGRNSNYIALYQKLNEIYVNRSRDARRAIIVITDSIPCYPEGKRDPALPLYDQYCSEVPSIVRHIQAMETIPGAAEYVFFIPPVTSSNFWENFPDVREAWAARVNRIGKFDELVSINELPAVIMDTVIREAAYAQGIVNPEVVTPSEAIPVNEYTKLGVLYAGDGRFNIGPFQSYMDVMVAMPSADTPLTFNTPNNTDPGSRPLYKTEDDLLRIVRIRQPAPGIWSVGAGTGRGAPTWILLRSAEVYIRFSPANPTRFVPQQIIYELKDDTGAAFPISADVAPDFDITLTTPDNENIDLSAMQVSSDGRGFESPVFLPPAAGAYKLSVNAQPGTSTIWRTQNSYDFLNPKRISDLTVSGIQFNADYAVEGEGHTISIDNENITMPRSLPLNIKISAVREDGSTAPLPPGLGITLNFTPPATGENACLEKSRPIPIEDDKRNTATTQIKFEQSGRCNIDFEFVLNSPLPPFSDQQRTVRVLGLDRAVNILETQRLTFRLLQQGNTETVLSPIRPSSETVQTIFHMSDVDVNVQAAPNIQKMISPSTLVLRAEIVNDKGERVIPAFLDTSNDGTRGNCVQRSANLTPETDASTQTSIATVPTEEQNLEADTSKIVPFNLVITDSSERNIAQDKGFCFLATDNPGVYLAILSDMLPGDYQISVSIDPAKPQLDYEQYEYMPSLFDGTSTMATIVTGLNVQQNSAWLLMRIAGLVVTIFLTLFIVGGMFYFQRITTASLTAQPTIYRVPKEKIDLYEKSPDSPSLGEEAELLWQGKLPDGFLSRRNSYEFKLSRNTNLLSSGLKVLNLTTRRNGNVAREGAFYGSLSTLDGDMLGGALIRKGTSQRIHEFEGGEVYFIANGLSSPTVAELLQSEQKPNI